MEKEKKDLVIIEKEVLLNLISRAHKWCAVWGHSDLMGAYNMDEIDAVFLEYAESTGLAFPEDVCGQEAIDILSEWDLDFYEVRTYVEREDN